MVSPQVQWYAKGVSHPLVSPNTFAMPIPKDKGARFHKCDFQVHTLRDAGWSGPFHPVNDRVVFATALVADCRRKNIQAIAITDHHDLCLWKTISNAAQAETQADGSVYPEE